MAIRQVITFRVQRGAAQAFIDGFGPIIDKVRGEDGCEQYELFVGHADPDVLVMLERWRDLAALQGALAKHYQGPDDPSVAFFKLVEGQPTRERYEG
ncbi:putative quinol monooxygenase [Nannocystis exedens]|uniref:putative quinol monooxygenase n=1 Tax=Nannocystis exedens TaxID=54 RepID=UPI000BBA02A8|nr:putative quinol monooxygenase [Nannocystis exedens]PCC68556.1 Antibiotic biosynthesis monooxygenase [Nannocystis exedens]